MMSRNQRRPLRPQRIIGVALAAVMMTVRPAPAHDPALHVAELTALLERQPWRADLHWRRGEQYRALQRWDEAATDFQAALTLDADFTAAVLALARTNLDRGRPEEAVSDAELILARRQDLHSAWLIYAQALDEAGFGAQAVFAYDMYLKLAAPPEQPPPPDVYLRRARLLVALGDDRRSEALEGLDEGIERLGGAVALHLEAIEIERSLGRYDDALRRVDGLLDAARRKEPWLARRAELLARAGRCDEAAASYRAALDQIGALPEHIRRTAATEAMRLEIERALAELDAAPTLRPPIGAAADRGPS